MNSEDTYFTKGEDFINGASLLDESIDVLIAKPNYNWLNSILLEEICYKKTKDANEMIDEIKSMGLNVSLGEPNTFFQEKRLALQQKAEELKQKSLEDNTVGTDDYFIAVDELEKEGQEALQNEAQHTIDTYISSVSKILELDLSQKNFLSKNPKELLQLVNKICEAFEENPTTLDHIFAEPPQNHQKLGDDVINKFENQQRYKIDLLSYLKRPKKTITRREQQVATAITALTIYDLQKTSNELNNKVLNDIRKNFISKLVKKSKENLTALTIATQTLTPDPIKELEHKQKESCNFDRMKILPLRLLAKKDKVLPRAIEIEWIKYLEKTYGTTITENDPIREQIKKCIEESNVATDEDLYADVAHNEQLTDNFRAIETNFVNQLKTKFSKEKTVTVGRPQEHQRPQNSNNKSLVRIS